MRISALALCGLMAAVMTAAPVQAQYHVGDAIDDFTLNDSNGTPVSLYDFQDTVIFLNFWSDT